MAAPGFKIGTRVSHKSGWLDFNLVASSLANFEPLNELLDACWPERFDGGVSKQF
jgi:hypothetical protein